MKRCMSLLLFLFMIAVPAVAGAVPSPLSKVSSSAVVYEEGTVQVISYKAYLKVESDTTRTEASLVIKNTSPDEKAVFLMGMPAFLDQGAVKVSDLTVIMDGVKQHLINRRNRTSPNDTGITDLPDNWSTWAISLLPNEHKVLDLSYTTENLRAADGTRSVFVPLEYLKAWQGTPRITEITIDLGLSAAPYIFEPNPSVLPHEYSETGRLTWRYQNTEAPGYIRFYFRNVGQLAVDYIKAQAPGDRTIQAIAEAFTNKSYDAVIAAVDQYLSAQSETTLKNELLFIKALSHQGLLQADRMYAIYNQLEGQPLFGELEGTVRNKIIYDSYHYLKGQSTDDAALYQYLDSTRNYVMNNALFLKWMENELSALQPPPETEPEPTSTPEALPAEEEPKPEQERDLVKTVSIAGVEVKVEFIFLTITAAIIALAWILKKKKNHRNRGYLFR